MPIFTRPNVLIVLLEYINLFQSEWQHEATIWEGYPALCHYILLYFIIGIAIVTNLAYFAQTYFYYGSILLFAFAFLLFQ